ncbi:type II toxin-antitoxin system RelE/ParE family toxin [Maribacter algicola]|uniref:Type II toxin-antitoxin system RelE/ParE family toxin n=1 Tax=Meishania litoralis TaxID=3434685 RepID=A0ACC7LHA2_9FLAO
MTVVWTRTAETSFNGIVDYLLELWTVEIATNFVDIVEHTVEQIIEHPEMFKVSEYDNQSRAALITKHTTMFYRVLDDQIEIEYFWGNFDNPDKIKDLLKSK